MTFDDIPLIFDVLKTEGLSPISSHPEGQRIVCEDPSGTKFFMKECRGNEKIMFENAFPLITSQKLPFKRIELPNYRNIVSRTITQNGQSNQRNFIFVNYYNGTTFNESWHETSAHAYGGRAVDVSLAAKTVNILEDLALVDLSQISALNPPTFDFSIWIRDLFPILSASLIQNGSLTQDYIDKAKAIFSSTTLFQGSQRILTNGDFYPRNFIELPTGKIVLIDWEGHDDEPIVVNGGVTYVKSQRNAFINYIENHAAFFFVHMWGSHAIQKEFIKSAASAFSLKPENLQAAILIKSLEQGAAFNGSWLSFREAEIFTHALSIDYVNDLVH